METDKIYRLWSCCIRPKFKCRCQLYRLSGYSRIISIESFFVHDSIQRILYVIHQITESLRKEEEEGLLDQWCNAYSSWNLDAW